MGLEGLGRLCAQQPLKEGQGVHPDGGGAGSVRQREDNACRMGAQVTRTCTLTQLSPPWMQGWRTRRHLSWTQAPGPLRNSRF